MMRILLTGADGFVGRHLLPLLAGAGELHALLLPGRPKPLDLPGVEWHECDLLHAKSRRSILRRVKATHLLHLAWVTAWGEYWESPQNLEWLKMGIDLIREFHGCGGQRLVGVGSCAEYDWKSGPCREEETPLRPISLYGSCKHALHVAWRAYASRVGLGCAWGRLFFLYGPYEQPQRLVPSAILSLLKGEWPRCHGGTLRRDYLHVQDAAAALAALLVSPVQGAVNIASGEAVSLADLVARIAAMAGRPGEVEAGAADPGSTEAPLVVADIARLQCEVGFYPRVDLDSGLRQSLEWWRMHPKWGTLP